MTITAVIAPVFLLVLAGYLAATSGVLRARDVEGLSRFVFNIALPVLLFQSLATVTLPEQLDWHFLLVYYLVVLVIYGLGMWLSQRWFATPAREQTVFGMGASYSNLMLVGLPIISAGLGDEALTTYKLAGHFAEAGLIMVLKLAVQPLLVWLLVFHVLEMDPLWSAVAVMAAGISAYIYAENYHLGTTALSTAVLFSTILTLFSQSFWLLLLT